MSMVIDEPEYRTLMGVEISVWTGRGMLLWRQQIPVPGLQPVYYEEGDEPTVEARVLKMRRPR